MTGLISLGAPYNDSLRVRLHANIHCVGGQQRSHYMRGIMQRVAECQAAEQYVPFDEPVWPPRVRIQRV